MPCSDFFVDCNFFCVFDRLLWLIFKTTVADAQYNIETLTLDTVYKLGLYVFAGQHKLTALKQLHKCYSQVKLYQTYVLGYIVVFESHSEIGHHHLKVVGNLANDLQELHQKRGFLRKLTHIRARYVLDGYTFGQGSKVIFTCSSSCFIIFCASFVNLFFLTFC